MIDLFFFSRKIVITSFGRTKLHKKRSRNIYLFTESYRDYEVNFLVLR